MFWLGKKMIIVDNNNPFAGDEKWEWEKSFFKNKIKISNNFSFHENVKKWTSKAKMREKKW